MWRTVESVADVQYWIKLQSFEPTPTRPLGSASASLLSFPFILWQALLVFDFAMLSSMELWYLCHWVFGLLHGDQIFLICDWSTPSHRRECIAVLVRFLTRFFEMVGDNSLRYAWLQPIGRTIEVALKGYDLEWTVEHLRDHLMSLDLWRYTINTDIRQIPFHQIPTRMSIHELTLKACDVLRDLTSFSMEDDNLPTKAITTALSAAYGFAQDLDGMCSYRHHPPIHASRIGFQAHIPMLPFDDEAPLPRERVVRPRLE